MTIALTYRRVSTSEQGKEGLSLDMQAKENARYSSQHGFYLGPQFVDVLSGMRDDRPGYQDLLAEIRRLRKDGEHVVVVVFRLDRFGRDTEERARSWKELVRLGVALHSVTEGGEISETQAYALAFAAQMLVTSSRDNIRRSMGSARSNGWWPAGTCPYGYRWRPRTDEERLRGAPRGVLDVEPQQAAHVAAAFRRLADGESAGSVHRWLANLPEEERGGRRMHRRSVFLMFKAPVYMGRFDADGPQGNWPHVVDAATWQAAQRVFDGHQVGGQKRAATGRYLLSGFIKCPACGHAMVGTSTGTTARRQVRYRCKAREYGRTCGATVAVEAVDREVLEQLSELLSWLVEPDKRTMLVADWNARRQTRIVADEERERRQVEREVGRDRTRLLQAIDKWNDGRLSDAEYYAYRAMVEKRVSANDKRLTELAAQTPGQAELPPLDDLLGPAPAWYASLHRSDDVEAVRRVLSVFVASVTARRTGWGRYDVSIGFTELGEGLVMLTPPGLEEVS